MTWPERKGTIVYQKIIARMDLRTNQNTCLYVFGDNLAEVGYGGQAKEMRDEPNAIGIPTKRNPRLYLNDGDFDEVVPIIKQKVGRLRGFLALSDTVVVFPADGIGTGLANLSSQAPMIWGYLCAALADIGIKNGAHDLTRPRNSAGWFQDGGHHG